MSTCRNRYLFAGYSCSITLLSPQNFPQVVPILYLADVKPFKRIVRNLVEMRVEDEVHGEMKSVRMTISRKHDIEPFAKKFQNDSSTSLKIISIFYLLHKGNGAYTLIQSTEKE